MRIYLSRPHMSGHERAQIDAAFESNFIAPLGPQLTAFENRIASYLAAGNDETFHCIGLTSGTAAMHLALRLVGVGQRSEVWVSSMTFAGGAFPILYEGARPVFFDLDPATWVIDLDLVEEALEDAARKGQLPAAIVPTDLYGQSVDLDRLEIAAARYGVPLVVDSAESLGAEAQRGRKCGTGGDVSILSFNGNKIITSSGGGMLVTRSQEIAEQARFLATQARDPAPHYEHSTHGYNYRLSNICAAIGLGQMEVLEDRVAARRTIFSRYCEELAHPGVTFMPETPGTHHSRWLTTITVDPSSTGTDREAIRTYLAAHEIEARPLWKPMHLQPLFRDARYVGRGTDAKLFESGLCLPSGSDISPAEQEEVVGRIRSLLCD